MWINFITANKLRELGEALVRTHVDTFRRET